MSNLGPVARGMEENADRIVRKALFDIEANAKVRVPVDTGNLRSTIRTRILGTARGRVEVGADYGVYVERGTRRNRPQPFFDPAIRAVEPGFMEAWRRVARA